LNSTKDGNLDYEGPQIDQQMVAVGFRFGILISKNSKVLKKGFKKCWPHKIFFKFFLQTMQLEQQPHDISGLLSFELKAQSRHQGAALRLCGCAHVRGEVAALKLRSQYQYWPQRLKPLM